METNIESLNRLIKELLNDKITADSFEKSFTEIFDFEDLDINEQGKSLYASIRTLLEHYSNSNTDLRLYPDFYIDQQTLKKEIKRIMPSSDF